MLRLSLGRVVLCLLAATVVSRVARGADASPEAELAWRLDGVSSDALGPGKSESTYRRSAAVLEAAQRLDPSQPRFSRLRTLALRHAGDVDGAIASLKQYRQISPATLNDRVAQAKLIDLYASKLETVEEKIKYIEGLLNVQKIPPEVRAHIAAESVELLAQRSPDEAAEMAKRAVQLYPLPEATRQYYERVARQQSLKEQVAALVAVLSANPNQPGYAAELARLLSSAGMADASLEWYELALRLILPQPTRPSWFHDLLVDYVSELMLTDHNQPADAFLGQMLDADPNDADAWFLKLALSQATSGQVTFEQSLDLARSALARRWNALHEAILKGGPMTRPATAPATAPAGAGAPGAPPPPDTQPAQPLDPAPVIQKLKGGQSPEAETAFVNTAFEMAWFELYFAKQPDAAQKWIDAIGSIVPADNERLQVLQGWQALVSNQVPKAREILSKLGDKAPLAGLGLIRADEAENKQPDPAAAQKLLDNNRRGLVAALLWEALKSHAKRPATQPAAEGVAADLERFPRAWHDVVDPRNVRKVYNVRAEPVQSTVPFGEPLLANVTVSNTSDHDITVGPQSLLRAELWFDAQTMGLAQQSFPGVAYDQIGDQLVLRPHTSIVQLVRVDQGDLKQVLLDAPGTTTRVNGDVITNPLTIPQGVVPGPGGQASTFSRTFGYAGISLGLPNGRKKIDAALASKSPAERLRALDLVASYVRLSQRPNVDEEIKKAVADLPAALANARNDPSPSVAAWAGYLWAQAAPAEEKEKTVREMLGGQDWRVRLLGVLAASFLPPDVQKQVLEAAAQGDADATVKAAAAASLDVLARAATQPATTAPSTQPATAPGL